MADEPDADAPEQRPSRLRWALIACAVAGGLLVGWLLGDHSGRDWLLALGGSFELFGVLLIASPEIATHVLPRLKDTARAGRRRLAKAWHTTRSRARKLWRRIRRRPGQTHKIHLGSVVSASAVGAARLTGGVVHPGDPDEQLKYLLGRDAEWDSRFRKLGETIAALPAEWAAADTAAAEALRDELTRKIEEVRDLRLPERLAGVALLTLGIILATIGNLL